MGFLKRRVVNHQGTARLSSTKGGVGARLNAVSGRRCRDACDHGRLPQVMDVSRVADGL